MTTDVALRRPPADAPPSDPPRPLDPDLRVDSRAAGKPGRVAARRTGDTARGRPAPPPVRPRPSDLRPVLAIPATDRQAPARHEHLLATSRDDRAEGAVPGDDRADARGDDLCTHSRRPARLPRR